MTNQKDLEVNKPAVKENSMLENSIKKSKKKGFDKNALSILRTTLRNNIELTSIADNKANVLLSLNALMLTFLAPTTIPNLDLVQTYRLGIPLIILALTCLTTIYLSVLVLMPSKFKGQGIQIGKSKDHMSPFFFGNFHKIDKLDYLSYSEKVLKSASEVQAFISNDFYHIGYRLAQKMKLVRVAYSIFIAGMSTTIVLSIILIAIFA